MMTQKPTNLYERTHIEIKFMHWYLLFKMIKYFDFKASK